MARNTGRTEQPDQLRRVTKHEQIGMITTLEKCTQLHHDDKAAIRRRLRQMDQQVVTIFTKHKKPINYHMLQIDLRKFAVKTKHAGQSNRLNSNKENQPNSCENIRKCSSTYRLGCLSVNNQSMNKMLHSKKDSVSSSKSLKRQHIASNHLDIASPCNKNTIGLNWFNKLQHKLKFKNQVPEQSIQINSKQNLPKDKLQMAKQVEQSESQQSGNCKVEQIIPPKKNINMCTKFIKQRIFQRNKKVENIDMDVIQHNPPKLSLPNPQQLLMFSFKNDMRLSLNNIKQDFTVNNISSLDASTIRQKESFHDTERKLILEMEIRRSSLPKRQPLNEIHQSIFKSQYDICSSKAELLKQLTIFKTRYAEDIMSYFYQSPRKLLSRQDFVDLMKQLLLEMNVSVKSLETMEQFISLIIDQQLYVSPVMLGNTLEIIAPIKHTDARLLFNLANKKNQRVLTIDNFLDYLREIVHSKELLSRTEYLVYELFYLCSKDGRLSYWDLYLAQESSQFRELCSIISQPQ